MMSRWWEGGRAGASGCIKAISQERGGSSTGFKPPKSCMGGAAGRGAAGDRSFNRDQPHLCFSDCLPQLLWGTGSLSFPCLPSPSGCHPHLAKIQPWSLWVELLWGSQSLNFLSLTCGSSQVTSQKIATCRHQPFCLQTPGENPRQLEIVSAALTCKV